MSYDPALACAALAAADSELAALIERVGLCRMTARDQRDPTMRDLFQSLLRSIVFQQLSGKAAGTIYERLQGLFGGAGVRPEVLLELDHAALRGAGLSRNKILAVRDLAAKTLEGVVPSLGELQRLDDEAVIERLVQVRGIGRWTVEMLLMFRLGRPDVLPVDDLGVRKGYMLTYRLDRMPRPAEMRIHAERWRPWRSVASWYMWRAVELRAEAGQSQSPPRSS